MEWKKKIGYLSRPMKGLVFVIVIALIGVGVGVVRSFGWQAAMTIPPPPYRAKQLEDWLITAWEGYKFHFILSTGQVIRPENNNDTVSEGQAYALLIAVQMNDKITFDRCLAWTEQHLSRMLPGSLPYGGPDHLLAWHWDSLLSGVQGEGWNAATDADQDCAYALLLAYEKWQQEDYLVKALAILNDILNKEVYAPQHASLLYLKPGTWGESELQKQPGSVINFSYFSPAWYRKFNFYLADERWQKLIDGVYALIDVGASSIINPETGVEQAGVGLLPDWAFAADSGKVYFRGDSDLNPSLTVSGWDACRVPWRIYTDVFVTNGHEVRAQRFLNQLMNFYQAQFNAGNEILATYYYNGTAASGYASPGASGLPMLGASLNPTISISDQFGLPQTALAYMLKSPAVNPPANNQFRGPDTFQVSEMGGVFIAPGDSLRYYINSLVLLGLLSATN